jgi:hypothetical protein
MLLPLVPLPPGTLSLSSFTGTYPSATTFPSASTYPGGGASGALTLIPSVPNTTLVLTPA